MPTTAVWYYDTCVPYFAAHHVMLYISCFLYCFVSTYLQGLDRTSLYRVLCVIWCRDLLPSLPVTQTEDAVTVAPTDLSSVAFDIAQRLFASKLTAVSTVLCAEGVYFVEPAHAVCIVCLYCAAHSEG